MSSNGLAVDFTNANLSRGNGSSIPSPVDAGSFTATCWTIKTGGDGVLMGMGGDPFGVTNSYVYITVFGNAGLFANDNSVQTIGTGAWPAGWNFVALVCNAGAVTSYVGNSAALLTNTLTGVVTGSAGQAFYLSNSDEGDGNWQGAIAGFKLWNKPLSQAEVFREARQRSPVRKQGLVSYFPMWSPQAAALDQVSKSSSIWTTAGTFGLAASSPPIGEFATRPRQWSFLIPLLSVNAPTPTVPLVSYPDPRALQRTDARSLHAFAPLPIVASVPSQFATSYPDPFAPVRSRQDLTTTARLPERTLQLADQKYPDPRAPLPPRPDFATQTGAPDRIAPLADQEYTDPRSPLRAHQDHQTVAPRPDVPLPSVARATFPDALRAPARAVEVSVGMGPSPLPNTAAPVQGYVIAPEVLRRQPATPDAATVATLVLTTPQFPTRYPDRVSVAPTKQTGTTVTQGAPERTASIASVSHPDVLRRAPMTADAVAFWPFPLPSLAAPTEGYASYPEILRRPVGGRDAATVATLVISAPQVPTRYPETVPGAPQKAGGHVAFVPLVAAVVLPVAPVVNVPVRGVRPTDGYLALALLDRRVPIASTSFPDPTAPPPRQGYVTVALPKERVAPVSAVDYPLTIPLPASSVRLNWLALDPFPRRNPAPSISPTWYPNPTAPLRIREGFSAFVYHPPGTSPDAYAITIIVGEAPYTNGVGFGYVYPQSNAANLQCGESLLIVDQNFTWRILVSQAPYQEGLLWMQDGDSLLIVTAQETEDP